MAQGQSKEKTSWYKAIQKLQWAFTSQLQVGFIAKVVSYDAKHHTADILPLALDSDGEESAQYLDVPVSENCYMLDEFFSRIKPEFSQVDSHLGTNLSSMFPSKNLIRPGVPVVCLVLDRDNDNWEGGSMANTYMPNSSRLHDGNDAIVVGVLGGNAVHG